MPYFFLFVLLGLVVLGIFSPPTRDDSDAAGGPRSGIVPLTDHLTGCQYLRSGFGGLTPRLDVDGRQICREDLTNK